MPYIKKNNTTKPKSKTTKPALKRKPAPKPKVVYKDRTPSSRLIQADSQTKTYFMNQRVAVTEDEYIAFLLENNTKLHNGTFKSSDYDRVEKQH